MILKNVQATIKQNQTRCAMLQGISIVPVSAFISSLSLAAFLRPRSVTLVDCRGISSGGEVFSNKISVSIWRITCQQRHPCRVIRTFHFNKLMYLNQSAICSRGSMLEPEAICCNYLIGELVFCRVAKLLQDCWATNGLCSIQCWCHV